MTDLSKVPTRVLLRIKNSGYTEDDPLNPTTTVSDRLKYNLEETISRAELLTELNTREHIPNKLESKRLRQKAAKKKK